MPNEWDLQLALVAIAEGDSGPGGMVDLVGHVNPVVEWGDASMNLRRPIIALTIDVDRHGTGTGSPLCGTIGLHVMVPAGAGGLESRILDRIEEVVRVPAFTARGLDLGLRGPGARRDLTALDEPGGGKRKMVEFGFTLTRA
jgi:hypothetical protein